MREEIYDVFLTVLCIIAIWIHPIFAIVFAIHMWGMLHHYGYTIPVAKMWNSMFGEICGKED